jgi:hypothetical protein
MLKKVLKYLLFFFITMVLLSVIPVIKLQSMEQFIISSSISTTYLLFEIYSPSYIVYYEKKTINSDETNSK